jgi:GNAT superfamily N-acetyltransferase
MISFKEVKKNAEQVEEVEKIYQKSFPSYQQTAFSVLLEKAEEERNQFYGIYDGDTLCGITYLEGNEAIIYVKYLAVSPEVRSQGYGSKILQALKDQFSQSQIYLDIETVDEGYENVEQRKKRQAFYFKNGFIETKYHLIEEGEVYDLLCSTEEFSIDNFITFMRNSSFSYEELRFEEYEK